MRAETIEGSATLSVGLKSASQSLTAFPITILIYLNLPVRLANLSNPFLYSIHSFIAQKTVLLLNADGEHAEQRQAALDQSNKFYYGLSEPISSPHRIPKMKQRNEPVLGRITIR